MRQMWTGGEFGAVGNLCLASAHRCVLLPLLGAQPPQRSLFLLVDSIDEGCQLGEGEQRSSPGSPRTIAELLASHHEFLPPWLLLVCSARRQNKAITKLFTGKRAALPTPPRPLCSSRRSGSLLLLLGEVA